MPDESRFPTMRFMKCATCGHVFVQSLSGEKICPECSSTQTSVYAPERQEEGGGSTGLSGDGPAPGPQ
jgi:hypothetical protein